MIISSNQRDQNDRINHKENRMTARRNAATASEATPTAASLSPKELAVLLDTDPKTVRKFLRFIIAEDNRPGKGSRWVLSSDALPVLTAKFNDWKTNRAKTVTLEMLTSTDEA